MNRTTRQRLFTAAFLLALCALLIAAGVALALAEGSHLPAAITVSVSTLAFFVLLLRTDVARLIGILRAFQLVGPILAFTLTSALIGKTAETLHFDEVGAQVLIVLLLARPRRPLLPPPPRSTASTSSSSSTRCCSSP